MVGGALIILSLSLPGGGTSGLLEHYGARQRAGPLPPHPRTGLPEMGRGPGQSTVSWERGSLPPHSSDTQWLLSPPWPFRSLSCVQLSPPSLPRGLGWVASPLPLRRTPEAPLLLWHPFLLLKLTFPQGVESGFQGPHPLGGAPFGAATAAGVDKAWSPAS